MLNEKGQRELVYVVKIDEILPIEGADRVEIAKVGGWRIMVKKGQFQVDDLAVYFEIDSRVPEKEPFLFLKDKNFRIKTQKYFKGTVISQGLLMSFDDLGFGSNQYKLGDFLTEKLGISYYVAEDNTRKAPSADRYKRMAGRHSKLFQNPIIQFIYKSNRGKRFLYFFLGKKTDKKAEWPNWVVKTDEERVQNIPWVLEDKSEWVATEKIDGTSTTVTLRKGRFGKYSFMVCSRNVVFTKVSQKTYYDVNVYMEMAEKYHMEEVLRSLAKKYSLDFVTLQGETYGKTVQKREYGLKEHDFVGFNLIFSDRGRIGTVEAAKIMKEYEIPWVPIIDEHFILPDTVDELLAIATGKSEIDGGMREGIVFRSQDGSKSFKAVSNEYLIKYHG